MTPGERTVPRDGTPYRTPVGTFVRYRVGDLWRLDSDGAALAARGAARDDGHEPIDVSYTTLQSDGTWTVEVRVA